MEKEELLDDPICCDNPIFEDMTLWGRTGRRCLSCGETWVSVGQSPDSEPKTDMGKWLYRFYHSWQLSSEGTLDKEAEESYQEICKRLERTIPDSEGEQVDEELLSIKIAEALNEYWGGDYRTRIEPSFAIVKSVIKEIEPFLQSKRTVTREWWKKGAVDDRDGY